MGSEASSISDHIWLSGRQILTDPEFFRANPIDAVITVMLEEEVRDYGIEALVKKAAPNAVWHWFVADDSEDEQIYRHFFDVHTCIQEVESAGKKVLVHCAGGISRSPTLVIAHLMQARGWRRDKAIEHVKKRREFIQPNDGFMKQLNMLERFLDQK